MTRAYLAIVVALATLASSHATPSVPAAAERAIEDLSASELREHVTELASDRFMGRGVGHPGNRLAEEYAAGALQRAQVPAAGATYLQPVEIYEPTLGSGRLTVTGSGGERIADVETGADFFPLPGSSDLPAGGRLISAGYGISAPSWRHDDYARLDARGAIVVVGQGVPGSLMTRPMLPDEDKSDLASLSHKIEAARAHGAAGLLVVPPRRIGLHAAWPERTSVQSASYRLFDEMRARPLAVAHLSGTHVAAVQRALESGQRVHAVLTPGIVARRATIHNVIGAVRGRDRADQLVVLGAHLDHDGIDADGHIYNGADDNASGTAAVLALGAAFARAAAAGVRPSRTIVLALWNGEEKGFLGSKYYVGAPLPAGRIVANLNLDMIGRSEEGDPGNPGRRGLPRTSRAQSANVVHVLGYSYSPEFARLVEQANAAAKLTLKEEYDRGAHLLVRRSDHWPFLEHGIPALFLTTGLHPDYHTPADDTERIEFGKLERIAELAGRVVWMAAEGPVPRMKTRLR